jgi:ABC-type glutathione transport system ATPase component
LPTPILKIHNLNLVFGDDVFRLQNLNNIEINKGEIIGVLGESGCGKTTFGKCLIGLINHRDMTRFGITSLSDKKVESNIEFLHHPQIFGSNNLLNGTKKELLEYRKHVQMIFQQPRASLNMNMPVRKILEEAARIDDPKIPSKALEDKIKKLADKFELGKSNWDRIAASKPKELSGGERRRLGIAKVFAVNPDIIIADEPVASLDVSVRGKILNTLYEEWEKRYKQWESGERENPLTIIIISHDYNLIQSLAHKVLVFYGDVHVKRGTIVDYYLNSQSTKVGSPNKHPYSQKLESDSKFMVEPNTKKYKTDQIKKIGSRKITNGCIYINNCPIAGKECSKKGASDWNYSSLDDMPCRKK